MGLKAAIGIDDFQELIKYDHLYVDKSLLIEEILEASAKVLLIARPRRFGKTINLSMLRYFFDKQLAGGSLFGDLAIEQRPCFERQGQYPTIFLTFKDLKADHFEEFFELFAEMMGALYHQHLYLTENLDNIERDWFLAVAKRQATRAQLTFALATLTEHLERHHGRKVMLLIDEYDSPIHEGYTHGYYDQLIGFMRPCLGKTLKGNPALEKAVLTGILRVAKESIFSDLNHLKVLTLLDDPFSDKFGFTVDEVTKLLELAGRVDQKEHIDQWYNGYLIGDTLIYNPWSILNYLDDPKARCQPYWVNTSTNELIRSQLLEAPPEVQDRLNQLMQGGAVETTIQQHTVFRDLSANAKHLWSFFLFSGYLTVRQYIWRDNQSFYQLAIPNLEVKQLFETIITDWLHTHYGEDRLQALLRSLTDGNVADFEKLLGELVAGVLSFYDTDTRYAERVYHAFVLGLVVNLRPRYEIRSNRESGFGRYDLLLRPRNPKDRGIIMEFKIADSPESMDVALDAAEKQMRERAYAIELAEAGVSIRSEIVVAFFGKQVMVRGREVAV